MKKTIFCICGRSASGKDTIANRVSEISGVPKVVSYTTRPRRDGEREDSHIFLTEEEFELLKLAQMCAYTRIGQYHYFTTRRQLLQLLYKHDAVIYVIDPDGIQTLKASMPDVRIVTIYINVTLDECVRRAEQRGDSKEGYRKRAQEEMERFYDLLLNQSYDYAVPNRDVNLASDIIAHIIFRETRRAQNCAG